MNIIRRREKRPNWREADPERRIRTAARACQWWGFIVIAIVFADGVLIALDGGPPVYGADAYTDTVARLKTIDRSITGAIMVLFFVSTAVLRALADLYKIAAERQPQELALESTD